MSQTNKEAALEMPKAYEAKTIDAKWYGFWERSGYFKPNKNRDKSPYCIVMPPPNVTGSLHIGHALVNTLQDVLIRWKRMCGHETLWMPGTDHAGIATQTVVEKHLFQTLGRKRKNFDRHEFLQHVWQWKEEKESNILSQLKYMGCSCDWSQLRFTMDEGNNLAVRKMFKKMYDQGLIYKGDYLVNWDTVTQTALADDEVEYEERNSYLWHFKYPLADTSGFVHIATTRPETMLGDTAIAVSPKDVRYQHLIGKRVKLPIVNREIPVIGDYHVDPQFGTGMVKVTPAHDPNDYKMGETHGLAFINIMTPEGLINQNGGKFEGLTMEEARVAVVEEMKNLGLFVKLEPHTHRVGISYRSKAVIEPFISKQWFIKMEPFAKRLREAVEKGQVKLIPPSWENTYFHWIDNLRDWCISRQLWWGHRIPIWTHVDDASRMICYDGDGVPPEVEKDPNSWIRDEDVLDTWFSAALWPFSTLGWPNETLNLQKFYPNSTLITGHDILFFWVARMILMGEYAMGQVPFPEVFLHGLIYGKSYWRNREGGGIAYLTEKERYDFELGKPLPPDVHCKWEKMSKSKGNVIDPITLIETFGTDAVRMTLCAITTQSREIDLDLRKFEEFKNFANKIWNGARFIFMNLDGDDPLTVAELGEGIDETLFTLEDKWILSRLNRTIRSVNDHLQRYQFDRAAMESYDFYWKELCAYYVEIAKPDLFCRDIQNPTAKHLRKNKQKLLTMILCQAIRLIHPMAPFISEELFQLLITRFDGVRPTEKTDPYTAEMIEALQSPACIVAPYPKIIRESDIDETVENDFHTLEKIVYAIRNIRGEMKLQPKDAAAIHIVGSPDSNDLQLISKHQKIITALVKTSGVHIHHVEPKLGCASEQLVDGIKVIIPLPEELMKQEKVRLDKERERLEVQIGKINTQLSNESFVSNAPKQLVEKQRGALEQSEKQLREVLSMLKTL